LAEIVAPVAVGSPEVLDGELDRRERVLDLVRDLARHLAPREHALGAQFPRPRAPKLPDHTVEGGEKLAELAGAGLGQPDPKPPCADNGGRAAELADRSGQRPADGDGEPE